MKNRPLQFIPLIFWIICLLSIPACKTVPTTLAPGGAYTHADLAQIDTNILDAEDAMNGYVQWADANAVFISAHLPAAGLLKGEIQSKQKSWMNQAWTARKAYAEAEVAYEKSKADSDAAKVKSSQANLDAAIAVLKSITTQVQDYMAAHPPAPPAG